MTRDNTDTLLREYPVAGSGRVDPIAAILRLRSSIPNKGDDLGFKSKETGRMVDRRRREGKRREWKKINLTDNNGASKRGQTADEEKNKKGVISWTLQASYIARWSDKIPLCISRSSRGVLLNCEASCRHILDFKCLFAALS